MGSNIMYWVWLHLVIYTCILHHQTQCNAEKTYLVDTKSGSLLVSVKRPHGEDQQEDGTDYVDEESGTNIEEESTANEMINKDVYGCGGWIDIWCPGSSIHLHKALWSCTERDLDIMDLHLKKVRDMCEGKERCKIEPSNKLLGDEGECAGYPNEEKQLWLTYSCEGYEDKTEFNDAHCEEKE